MLASLSENCWRFRPDKVHGQISLHIFAASGGFCLDIVYINSQGPKVGYCLSVCRIFPGCQSHKISQLNTNKSTLDLVVIDLIKVLMY